MTEQPHSSPVNDTKLLEDEFIIDESDKSFASPSWITIPRKTGPLKQCTMSHAKSNTTLLQSKTLREKHPRKSMTLTQDISSPNTHPKEKSQPSEQKNLGRDHALTDEMENSCRSAKSKMPSVNMRKSSRSKRTMKENQRSNSEVNIVEEQVDVGQPKDTKTKNRSNITQDKLQKNSDLHGEEFEEMRSDHISPKQLQCVGKCL